MIWFELNEKSLTKCGSFCVMVVCPSLPKLESAGSASTGAFSTSYLNCVGKGTFQSHLILLCYGGLFVILCVPSPFLFRTILIFNDSSLQILRSWSDSNHWIRAMLLVYLICFRIILCSSKDKLDWCNIRLSPSIFHYPYHHPYSIALSVYHHIPIH